MQLRLEFKLPGFMSPQNAGPAKQTNKFVFLYIAQNVNVFRKLIVIFTPNIF